VPIFQYAKLVRDNIADWHIKAGHTPKVTYLKGTELIQALSQKLHEEADEVAGASPEELAEEIADVQQILNDICAVTGIELVQVEEIRSKKEARKGGFQRGVYIDSVVIPNEEDEWVQYCRRAPEKYPEISDQ
jgi:predicted house-cleaning noncanonical NTP pyrophosphatase (MazG superfamily)